MRAERRLYLQDVRDRLQALAQPGVFADLKEAFGACRAIWPIIDSLSMVSDIRVQDAPDFAKQHRRISEASDGLLGANWGIEAVGKIAALIDNALREPPPPQHSHFPGMKDPALRTILENDLAEATDCLQRQHYKACIVLCGSILEAALYEYLRRDAAWAMNSARVVDPQLFKRGLPDIASNDRNERWSIPQLITFAIDNKILKQRGTAGVKDTLADSRNLIHPAAVLRGELPVSKETAAMAFSQMEFVLKNLSQQSMPPQP